MQPNVQRFLLNAKFLSNASKFDQSDEECISYSYVTILLMNIYGFRSWLSERAVSSYLYEASYLQGEFKCNAWWQVAIHCHKQRMLVKSVATEIIIFFCFDFV